MKKVMMMMAMLAVSFAMQAQTKFHDVEANEATGPVKCIKTDMMGRVQVIDFTKEGKMQSEDISDAVYDADGYMQSAKMSVQGMSTTVKYTWKDGRIASQAMEVMGQEMVTKVTYNDKGAIASQTLNAGGQEISIPFTDYKYDDHGNWISRKTSMMGQEMEITRTIEYYE